MKRQVSAARAAAQALLAAASLAYPFLWYCGREAGWFAALAAGMMVLWLARAAIQKQRAQQAVSLLLAAFFGLTLLWGQPESMYWYPVFVSLLMLLLFGGSLFSKQSIIERLARIGRPDLPPEAVAYTRRVTCIWCVFFIFNGSVSALLALSGNTGWWAAYTGIISYLLMGLLGGGELLYRKLVLKV